MAAMLRTPDAQTADVSACETPAPDAVQSLHGVIERLQAEVKFKQTRIEALNFEIARLKRWRFGSSSESLEASNQAVLFDAIVADTRVEDEAEQGEREHPRPRPGRQHVRRCAARCPRACRASSITTRSKRATAPAASPSSVSART